MPEAAPVTSATLFLKDKFTSALLLTALSLPGTFFEHILCDRQRREGVRPTDVEGQVRDDLRGLRLRQAVIHRPVEVVGNLRHLAGSNQGADGDQAAVPGREVGTQPKVAEEDIGGVLHDSRRHLAELLSDARRTLRLGGLVERKKLRRSSGELIGPNSAPSKDVFRDRGRRYGVRPARVEREMRDDFGNLARRDAVIECKIDVVRHLDRLIACDQGGERHDAAVAWHESRPLPYLAEKTALRVLLEGRSYRPDTVRRQHWLQSLLGLRLLARGRRCSDQKKRRERRGKNLHFDLLWYRVAALRSLRRRARPA